MIRASRMSFEQVVDECVVEMGDYPIIDRQPFDANVMLSSNNDDNNEPPNEGMELFDMDGPKKEQLANGFFSPISKEEDSNVDFLEYPEYESSQLNIGGQYKFEQPLEMELVEDRRDTETATPRSSICDVSQMTGPEGERKPKRGGVRRVPKIKEAKDECECELYIIACRPYVKERKRRVNLKDPQEKEEQKKQNALNNSGRFRKRNKDHISNLEKLLQAKRDELEKVKKSCIELQNMDRFLEFNFRKNRQKALNFVSELADYSNLDKDSDAAQRLDQHLQFSSKCTLEDQPQSGDMYGEAAEQMEKEKKLENYSLHEMHKGNNDPAPFALENKSPHSSQNDANEASQEEFSDIATVPTEDKAKKNSKSDKDKAERRKESNRKASAKCRENEKSRIERLSNDIREVWWDVEEKRYIETFLKNDYAKKLERAKECIDPLVEWVYYLLKNLAYPVHFARMNQIDIDIKEIKAAFDIKPFAD